MHWKGLEWKWDAASYFVGDCHLILALILSIEVDDQNEHGCCKFSKRCWYYVMIIMIMMMTTTKTKMHVKLVAKSGTLIASG